MRAGCCARSGTCACVSIRRRADGRARWYLEIIEEPDRTIVKTLHKKRVLRPGLSVDRAADIMWTLNHPDLWHLLVGKRRWPPDEYERWFAETGPTRRANMP
jgi:hypothetical protein